MTDRQVQRIKSLLPYQGVKRIAEETGFSRSTVVDCLTHYREGRRIDADKIYKCAHKLLKERGIIYEG